MALRVGIVGLPNVGKSTLFKALTKKQVDCANYPFCTIEPNIGVVKVFDERVSMLANLMNSKRKIYTTTEFVDIAGLVEGANCLLYTSILCKVSSKCSLFKNTNI